MPALVTIGGTNTLFVGEDKVLRAHIKDSTGVPVNIAGWAISFVVRSTDAAVPAVVSATATISGTYNVDPAVNAQRAVVTLTDDQLSIPAGTYRHSWKRTDAGSETILGRGKFVIEQATQT